MTEPDRLDGGAPWRYKIMPGKWHFLRMTFRPDKDVWVVQSPEFSRLTKTGELIKDMPSDFKNFDRYTGQVYHTLGEAFALAEKFWCELEVHAAEEAAKRGEQPNLERMTP